MYCTKCGSELDSTQLCCSKCFNTTDYGVFIKHDKYFFIWFFIGLVIPILAIPSISKQFYLTQRSKKSLIIGGVLGGLFYLYCIVRKVMFAVGLLFIIYFLTHLFEILTSPPGWV